MIGMIPSPGTYGAAVVAGLANTAAEALRGAVILKAVYDLVADGANACRPVLVSDAGQMQVRMKDDLSGGVLRAEADIAVQKARTDIVVLGHVDFGQGGTVRVNGDIWMRRPAIAPIAGDMNENLFGWHARTDEGRALTDKTWTRTAPGDLLPPGYGPMFNNFYIRHPLFPQQNNVAPLPPGAIVTVHKRENEADTGYRFVLPSDRFAARVRFASGHCPDRPGRWAIHGPIAMAADTMIVDPVENRLTLLWRANWPWPAVPTDSLRTVEILREET